MTEPAYVYVLVRTDLPWPHLAVQAIHGAIAATNTFGEPNKTHPNLVLCRMENESALLAAFNRLKSANVRCCAWYEPDQGDTLTAIATAPLREDQRKPLKRFRLL